jgi:LacI family transcriptional regulator
MAVTIKDIARTTGVSTATVSLVLNNRPGVGQETRNRIFEAAAKLGYQTKSSNQAENISGSIRFLRIAKHGHIINPSHREFVADYIYGMEREASRCGYTLEVSSIEGFSPDAIRKQLEPGTLCGLVVLGTELNDADFSFFSGLAVPLVFIDTFNPYLDFDYVDMNNEASVYQAVSYLRQCGHTDIGLVKSSVETRNFRLREKAFMDSLEVLGLDPAQARVFAIDSTYEQGFHDMVKLLGDEKKIPAALFCVNDIIAYACKKALEKKGLTVPDDVSLVGFDDLPGNIYINPPLTSVKVSKRFIGEQAMQLLINRIQDARRPSEKVLVSGELVIRGSVRLLRKMEDPITS